MYSRDWSIGLSKHEKGIEYHVHMRSTDHFKQIGVREKNDRNEIKVLNIDTNFVVFKNKCMDKSKNLCLFKFGLLGYRRQCGGS